MPCSSLCRYRIIFVLCWTSCKVIQCHTRYCYLPVISEHYLLSLPHYCPLPFAERKKKKKTSAEKSPGLERKPCLSASFFYFPWNMVVNYGYVIFAFAFLSFDFLIPFVFVKDILLSLYITLPLSLFLQGKRKYHSFSVFPTRIFSFHIFLLFYSSLNSLYYYVLILVLKWSHFSNKFMLYFHFSYVLLDARLIFRF